MGLLATLRERWAGREDEPFLIDPGRRLTMAEVLARDTTHLDGITPGEVVALVGDFDAGTIADLFTLVERGAVVVPLSPLTAPEHPYFFDAALVGAVVHDGRLERRNPGRTHPLLEDLRARAHPGLVLFSTGTTGRPKAILHDMTVFLRRFETPRPTLRTLGFLLFDHIGGINTLLHTVFNQGVVVASADRSPVAVLATCAEYGVEVLPTTPTYLRLLLLSGLIPDAVPDSLRIVTYGTERMDQVTLDRLCELLPAVDFRQTFGMSELGIVRVKSRARDSLYMRIGGEGVRTRVIDGALEIWSPNRMLGYLNAPSPFDAEGWYPTGDLVEVDGDELRIVGRTNEVVNVGGLKFLPSEVEVVALAQPGVRLATARGRPNPITGQHVELLVEPEDPSSFDVGDLRSRLAASLPRHMVPARIRVGQVDVGHRFKRV